MKTVIYFEITLCFCIMSFILKWKNLIGMLLTLETFMLVLMNLVLMNLEKNTLFYFIIIILISEAVLGISILIMNLRFFGNDFSMNFFW